VRGLASLGKTPEIVGKDAYRAGSALLRPDKAVCVAIGFVEARVTLAGKPKLGMVYPYGRSSVMGSDDQNEDFSGATEGPDFPLIVRNATSNNLSPTLLEGDMSAWQVGVFGPYNDEIIVNGFLIGPSTHNGSILSGRE